MEELHLTKESLQWNDILNGHWVNGGDSIKQKFECTYTYIIMNIKYLKNI